MENFLKMTVKYIEKIINNICKIYYFNKQMKKHMRGVLDKENEEIKRGVTRDKKNDLKVSK